MAVGIYKYEGVNSEGKKVSGEVEGHDVRSVKKTLRRRGIRARKVIAPSLLDIDLGVLLVEKGIVKPFGLAELSRFTRQLSILINAGVPILESLEMLAKQEKNSSLRTTIKDIVDKIGSGKSLFESMDGQRGFSRLYTALIKAGEAAGILDTILTKLNEFMERQEAIRKRVKGAMTYPAIVMTLGLGITWGLMVYVVPQFVGMLSGSGQEIPWITQTVIDISDFFRDYTLVMLPALAVGTFIFLQYIKTTSGKKNWDRFTMKAPLFGDVIIKGNLASLFRTLATMLAAGVPLIECLDICIETLDNTQIAKDIKAVRNGVVRGKSITEPLGRIKYFPDLVNQMVKVGESTGNLDEMLVKIADVFEQETNETIDTLTGLMEPLILVILGGIIGAVLVAMYLPIFMAAGSQ